MWSARGRRKACGRMGSLSPASAALVSTLVPLAAAGAWFVGELAYVAINTPRLPEAPGPTTGVAEPKEGERGTKEAVRLLCLGDSVAAGCGLRSNEEACAGTFARHFAQVSGRKVQWRVLARNGYTAKRIEEKHLKRIDIDPDVVVLSVGVNNLLERQSEAALEADLSSLLDSLRAKVGPEAAIVVLGMPPMSMFVALTPILRRLAGAKAR